jgi:hypothetical protein
VICPAESNPAVHLRGLVNLLNLFRGQLPPDSLLVANEFVGDFVVDPVGLRFVAMPSHYLTALEAGG